MAFEGLGLLWLPYLFLLVFLLCLLGASFSHYHKKWADRYRLRAELKQQKKDGTFIAKNRAGMLIPGILQLNKTEAWKPPAGVIWTPPLERKADLKIKPLHVHRTEVREAASKQRTLKSETKETPLVDHCWTNNKLADEDYDDSEDEFYDLLPTAGSGCDDAMSSRHQTPRPSIDGGRPHKQVVTSFWSTASSGAAHRDRNRKTTGHSTRAGGGGFHSNI